MAGIGFHLRRLASKDNLSGIVRAYFHASIVAAGPWIAIVVAVALIISYTSSSIDLREQNEFLSVIIYNLFFSFIFSGNVYLISARYVADCLYLKSTSPIPGIFVASLGIFLIMGVLTASAFYIFYANMTAINVILSIVNFVLFAEIWIVMLYLGCISNYRAITLSWVIGGVFAIFLAINLGLKYGSTGCLFGLNLGLVFLLASLKANILVEYPYNYRKPKEFLFYFRHYQRLFWSGSFLYAGMWIDKVIMWWAPEATVYANNLQTYPVYDGAMFLSYLSIIPALGLFVFSLETHFYDSYINYIRLIERNAPLFLIDEEKNNIFVKIKENARSILILQGSISLLIIAFAPSIFNWFGTDFIELGIFRQGVLGAFFAVSNLIIIIIFSYFDSQNNLLLVTATMLFSNVVFTLLSVRLGFPYYGYGYSLAMILTFFVGSCRLILFLKNLNYHIFITNIVKRQVFTDRSAAINLRIDKKDVEGEIEEDIE